MASWQQVSEAKRAQREALIPDAYKVAASWLPAISTDSVVDFPRTAGILTEREIEITETDDVSALLAKLASSEYTAVEVLEAFIKRTCIAHQLVNPVTEIHFEDARKLAAELDTELKATGKVRGPLHGLPISVKDQFQIKGSDSTIGYISYANKPSTSDSVLVQILKKAGAVPFVKTNLPQTIMYSETSNSLWGTTLNPHNRTLHPGGSSGGEGALVAIKGSPLGVGTDVGGSVRIPAALCGVFGLRPCSHRFPYEGVVNTLLGQITIPSVIGPLSRSLSGVIEFSKAVLAQQPWLLDPQTPSMPWNEERFQQARTQKKLNIGVMWHDGHIKPMPPYERAIKELLSSLGDHDLIDFEPYKTQEAMKILVEAFCADGGKDISESIAPLNEPLGPCLSGIGQTEYSAFEVWQANRRKLAFQKEYLDHWNATSKQTKDGRPIDLLIVPGMAYTAIAPGNDIYVAYTGIFNLVDYPAVVLPITKVDPAIDGKLTRGGEFLSDDDERWSQKWDAEKLVNAPVSVQVVGRRYEEEAVLGYAEQLWATFTAASTKGQ